MECTVPGMTKSTLGRSDCRQISLFDTSLYSHSHPISMASSSRSALTCLSPISTASRSSGRALRQYSSKPDRHITILGEGLTGLYAAYRLSSSPGIKVTLLDSASRVGGWVDSRNRPVSFTDEQGHLIEGEVTLESGPRSIRPRASRGAPLMLKLVSLSR